MLKLYKIDNQYVNIEHLISVEFERKDKVCLIFTGNLDPIYLYLNEWEHLRKVANIEIREY